MRLWFLCTISCCD